MSPVWLSGLAALALVTLAAAIAGLSAGAAAACAVVATGAIVVLGWHLFQLHRLLRWAAGPIEAQVPEGRGIWGRVFTAIYRRLRLRSGFTSTWLISTISMSRFSPRWIVVR